jgi:hypothetical protein
MSKAQTITRQAAGTWYGDYGIAMCPAHPNTRTPALSLANVDASGTLAKMAKAIEGKTGVRLELGRSQFCGGILGRAGLCRCRQGYRVLHTTPCKRVKKYKEGGEYYPEIKK